MWPAGCAVSAWVGWWPSLPVGTRLDSHNPNDIHPIMKHYLTLTGLFSVKGWTANCQSHFKQCQTSAYFLMELKPVFSHLNSIWKKIIVSQFTYATIWKFKNHGFQCISQANEFQWELIANFWASCKPRAFQEVQIKDFLWEICQKMMTFLAFSFSFSQSLSLTPDNQRTRTVMNLYSRLVINLI